MIELAAVLFDRRDIVGAVHQVIKIGNPSGGDGGKRNGDLAVMHRRRGQHATDGNFAVRGVDMQLIAGPGFLISFGVTFGAHVAGLRQISEHRGRRHSPLGHARLAFDPARRRGGPDLSLAGPASFAFGFRYRFRLA